MKGEGEKGVECYPFLLEPLFCWPLYMEHISALWGAVVPVQCLQDQRKQRRQRWHQQLHLRILHGTQSKSFNRESQADGPHLVARVSVVQFVVRLVHW